MKQYIVTKPWKKGQQAGEVFETKALHRVLKNHVIENPKAEAQPEQKQEAPKQGKK